MIYKRNIGATVLQIKFNFGSVCKSHHDFELLSISRICVYILLQIVVVICVPEAYVFSHKLKKN